MSIYKNNSVYCVQQCVEGMNFDEERALFRLCKAKVKACNFKGVADGESPLKEAHDLIVEDCSFELRYALWHNTNLMLLNSHLCESCRAPLWYGKRLTIDKCELNSIKALRDSREVVITNSNINSAEFGWKCKEVSLKDSVISSEYIFFDAENVTLFNVHMNGKYSFQYMDSLLIEDSILDTKDAFWHSNNVIVRNSTIKGEYLAWYSHNLTLENCHIEGTQPLCHCTNLKLVNCTMSNCDLAFEDSDVEAQVLGKVDSI